MPRPLQVLAVSLPAGDGPAGRLLDVIDRLDAGGGVRVLDMVLVSKGRDGVLTKASLGADDDFGEIVSRLFPLGAPAREPAAGPAGVLWGHAQSLPAGTAVAYLLVEHRWGRGIFDFLDAEGGHLLGAGFLTHELGVLIDAEVTAMEDAAQSIAAAQQTEADALLEAAAARADADQAVAASARIRSAAAAQAVRALTEAGLIERTAAHEAAEALRAAGLLVAAADATTDEALAESEAAVAAADRRRADAAQAASITPAEIRVLRYLPTKLTFALIADKLGISREAAKSRAGRAYGRLGVNNRADAVKRARELNVIP